jgi:hypothetical protein
VAASTAHSGLVDAVAHRFAIGGAVGVDDEETAVRRPLRIAIPDILPHSRETVNAAGGALALADWSVIEVGDPDLGRAVSGVTLALVGPYPGNVGQALALGALLVLAVVRDEHDAAAVGGEGDPTVEAVVEDPAIGLVRAGQGDGAAAGAAGAGDEPDIGGGVRPGRGRRRLFPALRPRPC